MREWDKRKAAAVIGSISLLVVWLLVPIISQRIYGYSAITVAFVIAAVYFLGFQLWKRVLRQRIDL